MLLSPRTTLALLSLSYGTTFSFCLTTIGYAMRDMGFSYAQLGYISFFHLPYACKFFWAPFIDHWKIPWLHERYGHRKAWLIALTLCIAMSMLAISVISLHSTHIWPYFMMLIGLLGAMQEVLVVSYQVEILPEHHKTAGVNINVTFCRFGMMFSSGMALLGSCYMSWAWVMRLLALVPMVGFCAILWGPRGFFEPIKQVHWHKIFIEPLRRLVVRNLRWLGVLIAFLVLYRIQDRLMLSMPTYFLMDNFEIKHVAISKIMGAMALVFGGILGHFLLKKLHYRWALVWALLSHTFATGLFLLHNFFPEIWLLYAAVNIERFTHGIETMVFYAFQLNCCEKQYISGQISTISSIDRLVGVMMTGISGKLVECMGWVPFFSLAMIVALPAIYVTLKLPHRQEKA